MADRPRPGRAPDHSSAPPGRRRPRVALGYTPAPMSTRHLYKISFVNQGKVWEIYARSVTHGSLLGFVEVERLVFGERSSVVVDPAEERIKSEFAGVRRTFLPMHSVLRIDEVEKQGAGKITAFEGGNVAQFPLPVYSPGTPGEPGK
jgi:hypothetical protein